MKKTINKIVSIQISLGLIFIPFVQAADIEIDGSGTTLDKARNEVPIVNIANPNSSGLSHNKFIKYNVNTNGLILNNSKQGEINTQLSGYIYGNTNLSQEASAILNEVTSTNRTYLNGYTEIAGKKADVIIANPNGISINGAGFINANQVTLTTGKPNIINENIDSYSINGGDIEIGSGGFNNSEIDETNIYTHYLKLNGTINAKKLDIKLGLNEIDANGNIQSSSNSNETTNLLLDASSLGGMYANSIYLVGSDEGLGVNLPSEVLASSGEIVINNNGDIVLQKVSASQAISITSKNHTIEINNNIYTPDEIDLNSKDLKVKNGQIASKSKIDIDSTNDIVNDGIIVAGVNEDESFNDSGEVELNSKNIINNNAIISTKKLTLNTNNNLVNNDTILSNETLDIQSEAINNSGDISANSQLDIRSKQIDNIDGSIVSNNVNLNSENLNSSGDIIADILEINSTNSIRNSGYIEGNSLFTIASKDLNNSGDIYALDKLDIKSDDIINDKNIIVANTLNINNTNKFVNNGTLSAVSIINIDTKKLDAQSLSEIVSNTINIKSDDVEHAGRIKADDLLNMNNTNSFVNSGLLYSNNKEILNTSTLLNKGDIIANVLEINSTNSMNNQGYMGSNHLNITTKELINEDTIVADDIFLNASILKNLKSNIIAQNEAHITIEDFIYNSGYLGANDLYIDTNNLTNDGLFYSKNNQEIYVSNNLLNNGVIDANNIIDIYTNNLTNEFNITANKLHINSDTITTNWLIKGDDSLAIDATTLENTNNMIANDMVVDARVVNNSGNMLATNDLTISNATNINNTNLFQANNQLKFYSVNLNNEKNIIGGNHLQLDISDTITNNTQTSQLVSLDRLDIDTSNLHNDNGKIIFNGNGFINVSATLNNKNGIIQSAQNSLTLNTKHLNLEDGKIETAQDLNIITNTQTTSTTSKIYANNNLNYTLKEQGMTNDFIIESGNNLNLSINGDFISANDLLANGSLTLETNGHSITNNDFTISSLNPLYLSGTNLENNGTISGGSGVSKLDFSGDILNNSRISSKETLQVSANDIVNNGAINSGYDLQINSNNLTNNQTIFSNNNMYLYTNNILRNNEDANIFAMNNLVMAKDNIIQADGNLSKTQLIENISANIQTYNGDINVWAKELVNRRTQNIEDLYDDINTKITYRYNPNTERTSGNSQYYWVFYPEYDLKFYMKGVGDGDYTTLLINSVEKRDELNSQTSLLYSGKDLNINSNIFINEMSNTQSVGNINLIDIDSVQNKSVTFGTEIQTWSFSGVNYDSGWTDFYTISDSKHLHRGWRGAKEYTYRYKSAEDITSTIQAGEDIKGYPKELINGDVSENAIIASTIKQSENTSTTSSTQNISQQVVDKESVNTDNNKNLTIVAKDLDLNNEQINTKEDITLKTPISQLENLDNTITLPTNENGLFISDKDPNSKYLIEVNPEFTSRDNFIGSNYLLERLGYSPDEHIKFLGDGLYEQTLIHNQILNQTGRAFLDPKYASNEAQFMHLMDNALIAKDELELTAGIALTSEQINSLSQDILWMEEKVINGQVVLAPTLYLANPNSYKVTGGAILAGDSIALSVENMTNSGTLQAGKHILVDASNEIKNSGMMDASDVLQLSAINNITNTSGTMIGDSVFLESSEGSIINETFSKLHKSGDKNFNYSYTTIGDTATITSRDGNTLLNAKDSINNIGADIVSNNGSVGLVTKDGSINFQALKNENSHSVTYGGGFDKAKSVSYDTGSVSANGGSIVMQSADEINLEATKLKAKDSIIVNATNSINMTSVNNVEYRDVQSTSKSGGISKKTTVQRDMSYVEEVEALEATAANIVMNSENKDINLQGVDLQASQNLMGKANNGDINIIASQYKEGELHSSHSSRSLGGLTLSSSSDTTQLENLNLKESELKITKDDINEEIDSKSANDIANDIVNTLGNEGKYSFLNNTNEGMDFQADSMNLIASTIDSGDKDINIKTSNALNVVAGAQYEKSLEEHSKSNFNMLNAIANLSGIDAGAAIEIDEKKNVKTNTIYKSSSINGNNINIDSGEVLVAGSNVEASNDISVKTDVGDIKVVNVNNIYDQQSSSKKIEVKINNIADIVKDITTPNLNKDNTQMKVELGSATYDKIDEHTNQTKVLSSNIISKNGDVSLDGIGGVEIIGSNIDANKELTLASSEGGITIKEAIETTLSNKDETHGKATISATLKNEYVEATKAYEAINDAKKALDNAKQSKREHEKQITSLEQRKVELQIALDNNEIGITKDDIDELSAIINELKSDTKLYDLAIATATTNIATATTQALAASAKAAQSPWGFNAGLILDVHGEKSNLNSSSTTSIGTNITSNKLTIKTNEEKDTLISGSSIVTNDADIQTNNLTLQASQDISNNNLNKKTIDGSVSIDMYAPAPTYSLSKGDEESSSNTITYNNTNFIVNNNLNLTTKNDTTLDGANLLVYGETNANIGNNLNIISKINESNKNSNSKNMGVTTGGDGKLSGINGSVSTSKEKIKEVISSSFISKSANINVNNNTKLEGATLLTGIYDENGDFTQTNTLNLNTNTLTSKDLSNTIYKKGNSLGGGVSGDTVSTNYSKNFTYEKSKTLATLGNGNIQIKDTLNSTNLNTISRDATNINKELFEVNQDLKVEAKIDTRLLSEEGRNQIKDDLVTSSAITNAIEQIMTSDRADITDFFGETKKNVDVYNGMKQVIASNPQLANQLTDPNLTPTQKQAMLQDVANSVKISLGYETKEDDVKLISTNETGKDNTQIKGHYNNGNTYINDKNNDNTDELVNTTGHETQHAMDAIDNQQNPNNQIKTDENYATNFGEDVSFYTANALDLVTGQSFADTNNHVGTVTSTPSVFNDPLLNANTQEFMGVDKSEGEDRQLATEEKTFISENIEQFKALNKDTRLNGTQSEYSDDEAQRLLTTAAKILVDSESKKTYDENSNYANQNEFSQKEIDNAINYLQTNSQGETFLDTYKEDMTNQQLFTATPTQYKDEDYTPSKTIGLTDTSLETIPAIKAGVTTIKAGVEVAPSVVNGGKTVVNSVNQIDDDIGRYIQYQKDKLPDNKVNQWFTKETDQNVINDIFNESAPPATGVGVIVNTIKEIDGNKETIINTVKEIFSTDKNSSGE